MRLGHRGGLGRPEDRARAKAGTVGDAWAITTPSPSSSILSRQTEAGLETTVKSDP